MHFNKRKWRRMLFFFLLVPRFRFGGHSARGRYYCYYIIVAISANNQTEKLLFTIL
jgi:hypothetical protein